MRLKVLLLPAQGKDNTFVKCNPTLLGYEDAFIMWEWDMIKLAFGDFHFLDDLQFEDAVQYDRLNKLGEKFRPTI